MVRTISAVQIILALVGLLLLFTTPFATYDAFHGSWYNYGIWYNSDAVTYSLTGISVVLLGLIAYCGYMRGWASSAEIAAKYAKLTITLGLILLLFSIVIGAVSYVLALADSAGAYYIGTVPIAFLIGGVLFMLIGFVRPAAAGPSQG
jgi:hypothetical protein